MSTVASLGPRRALFLSLACATALSGCAGSSPLQAVQVASGLASQWTCIDTLETGLPPDQVRRERLRPLGGMHWLDPFLRTEVDAAAGRVRTTVAGGFASQASFRDGLGCMLQRPGEPPPSPAAAAPDAVPVPAAAVLQPDIAGPAAVAAATPALDAALRRAFDEPEPAHPLHTRAVVVVHHGRVVGERYAPGIGPETPLLGFSMSKSMTQALIGRLVALGRLDAAAPAPIAAWRSAGDAHAAITVEQLLRQNTGLDVRQDNSGFDANSRLQFIERDPAAFAAAQPLFAAPGTQWRYTDAHFVLLSRLLRDAVGGTATAVQDFAQRELFAPLGMRRVVLNFDATDTPAGASMFAAPARDWARLGLLYLHDGIAGGQRLLPEGWVRSARTPTLDTAYGAGWWTNAKGGEIFARWGVPWGFANAPRDAFFARGFMGQFVLVVPSRDLVLVRMGSSHQRGDAIEAVDRLVGEVLAALPD